MRILRVVLAALLCSGVSASARDQGLYLEVAYLHQAPGLCGPAVLSMTFAHWGVDRTQAEIARDWLPERGGGMTGRDLKAAAVDRGFHALSFEGDRETMLHLLKKGWPIILALGDTPRSNPFHFVLLVGWDAESEAWIVHDPAGRAYQRMRVSELERRHRLSGNWSLLITPAPSPEP